MKNGTDIEERMLDMNLKKIAALVAVLAMAASLSMPAFAEATPGESLAVVAQKPNATVEEVGNAVKDMTAAINADKETVVSPVLIDQGMRYFDMQEEAGNIDVSQVKEATEYKVISSSADGVGSVQMVKYPVETGEASIDVKTSGKNEYGFLVCVKFPVSVSATECSVSYSNNNANYSYQYTAKVENVGGQFKMVRFWVPHFSQYDLKLIGGTSSGSASTSTTTSTTTTSTSQSNIQYYTCKACGYHNWTATEEGYRCDNCGYIESQKQLAGYGNVKGVYAPKTGTENPIKATGADMNSTAFVVVALAVAAAFGMGYVAKKSGKAE